MTLPKSLLRTDAGRAAIASAWLDGHTQKEIAKAFGYKDGRPASVCNAILALIQDYCPEVPKRTGPGYNPWCYAPQGEERRPWARKAVERYRSSRA